jgi:predicted lipoprotein
MRQSHMRKKVIKYVLSILLIAFVGYKSMYFRKLDEVKAASSSKAFNASTFARNFYDNKLLQRVDSAVDLSTLVSLLRTDPEQAFKLYSRALAIGNIRYFLVRGEGTITSIGDDATAIELNSQTIKANVNIATEFVYGNAIRDASGLLNLNDFSNTADFNTISENINNIVRKEVLPQFVAKARPGIGVKFAGAIELNEKYVDLDSIEVVPIRLSLLE